jgi:hypothetical protein
VADVSGVLLHYKYDRAFRERCVTAVERGNFYSNSAAYRIYLNALEKNPQLDLKGPTARKLEHVNDLVESGYLRASQAYWNYVNSEGARRQVNAGPGAKVKEAK